MKVLLYESRKTDPILFDVSTQEKMHDALLALFNHFDVDWQFYDNLKGTPPLPEVVRYVGRCPSLDVEIEVNLKKPSRVLKSYNSPCPAGCGEQHRMEAALDKYHMDEISEYTYQKPLYDAARRGDISAIEQLLETRREYEYEGYDIIETTDPMRFLGEIIKRRKSHEP